MFNTNHLENYRKVALIISISFFIFLFCLKSPPQNPLLYSVPLLLSSSRWFKKRTWLAPVILAVIFILVQVLAGMFSLSFYSDYFLMVMFVFAVVMVAFLSERIEKVRMLNQLNKELDEEREKLESANQELEAFAYSVSHDLRVPLRAVDSFSRILVEDYQEKLDDEGERLIGIIRENTKKMGQLIDDILHLSRAGRQEMNMAELDLESITLRVFNELKQSNPDRNIQLEMEPLPAVYGDRILLQQVMTNLLSNSFKFTIPREIATIKVGFEEGEGKYIFYVKDNGVGFNMKYSNKLFGLFQRLHGQNEFEGTGVGLSIVQRIVRRHGGDVWADSKVDEGATFYFYLPHKNGHS